MDPSGRRMGFSAWSTSTAATASPSARLSRAASASARRSNRSPKVPGSSGTGRLHLLPRLTASRAGSRLAARKHEGPCCRTGASVGVHRRSACGALPQRTWSSCSVTNCTSRPHASITSSEEEQPGAGKQRRRQPGNCTESYASSACSELEDGNGASSRPSAHARGAGKQPRRCGRASRQHRTSAASSSASVRLRSRRWKERKSPETSAACMCFERARPNVCGLARSVRPTSTVMPEPGIT
mmetsp:Transcript_42061/g.136504  ORF Transcript_42061/g.136504 Transcript_42061/m.136504 type:complete len:241 (-) Transcript_42061:667-1389(-)